MHELPVSSWILIACSTLPWLALTLTHYLKLKGGGSGGPASAPHDDT